jgi:hypothetical protein
MERETKMVRLVGLEPTTGKSPADFKPAAYANFATAAPGVYAAQTEYHARETVFTFARTLADKRQRPWALLLPRYLPLK